MRFHSWQAPLLRGEDFEDKTSTLALVAYQAGAHGLFRWQSEKQRDFLTGAMKLMMRAPGLRTP